MLYFALEGSAYLFPHRYPLSPHNPFDGRFCILQQWHIFIGLEYFTVGFDETVQDHHN